MCILKPAKCFELCSSSNKFRVRERKRQRKKERKRKRKRKKKIQPVRSKEKNREK
jgi:hypothetical protein